MRNTIRFLLARYRLFVVIASVVMGIFQFSIPAVISGIDLSAVLSHVLASLPPALGAVVGEQVFGGLTTAGLLGFGWNHPVAHAAGTALAVTIGARAIAGEIEYGTLELVLAQPISRARYFAAHGVFAAIAVGTLCASGVVGASIGLRVFGVEGIAPLALVLTAANFWLLLCALFGVTLVASSYGREGGRALAIGLLVAVASLLAHTIAFIWPAAAFLGPYPLHSYYVPREVLAAGRIEWQSIAVLGGIATLTIAEAARRFGVRDVP